MRKLGVIDLDTFFPRERSPRLGNEAQRAHRVTGVCQLGAGVPLDIDALLYTAGKPNAAIIEIAHLSIKSGNSW